MQNKKILVTGGAGFIGSNLVKRLSNDNDIIVLDDLSSGHLKNIQNLIDEKKINFIKGCISDLSLLKKIVENVDYVFHLAAIASVPQSIKDPINTNNVNVNGTFNVLLAAHENDVKKVVYSSSCAVYGNPSKCPINENIEAKPLSPYATSKLIGEYYCQVFSEVYNLSSVSLRYFNIYGPQQDPASEYAAVIPKFIDLSLKNKELIIYGDGKQTRDFVFVKDVVNANILSTKKDVNGVFNVGSGKKTSINHIAESIIKISGKNLGIKYLKPRPSDILHSFADASKFEKMSFRTEYALENGLKQTYEWFKKKF